MFLTVGLNRSAPATYSSLSTVQSLLDHLHESQAYSDKDTTPIRKRLEEIERIVDDDTSNDSPEVIQLIKRKLQVSFQSLKEVEEPMNELFDGGLSGVLQELVALRREILSVGSKPKVNRESLIPLKEKLQSIEDERDEDGHFLTKTGAPAPDKAQSALNGLLDECHNLINDFSASTKASIPEDWEPLYDSLIEMKSRLENLLITHRWTLRETDLYSYQNTLDLIDSERSKKALTDPAASQASTIVLYLLRRCYAILYKLLESSQPVSEALIPIHNQLSTVRRCLLEVQRNGGLSSVRELYPYQMKLASIDNLRVDGKFMVGDSIPEGQGMLNALLSECFEICHELKMEIEENAANKEADDDDDDDDDELDDEEDDEEEHDSNSRRRSHTGKTHEKHREEDDIVQFTEGASDREEYQDDQNEDDDSDGAELKKIPSYKADPAKELELED